MKAIINGIRYDTEKARLIGEVWYGALEDFSHWEAGLYVTPRGRRYFLAGSGGPMTRWARPAVSGGLIAGEGIIPLTREEALEWAEKNLSAAEIEAEFGDMLEDA